MRVTTVLAVVFAVAACQRPQNPPDGGSSPPAPPPPTGVRVVDMIPTSLSGETWQDAEPFLTTFASNPNVLAASAFTPNPGGPASTTAPIYVTGDSGNTWSLRNTLPSNAQTADITHAGGESPAFYATILSTPSIALKDLETNDVLSATAMTQDATRPNVDQPFVRAPPGRPHRDRGRLAERGRDVHVAPHRVTQHAGPERALDPPRGRAKQHGVRRLLRLAQQCRRYDHERRRGRPRRQRRHRRDAVPGPARPVGQPARPPRRHEPHDRLLERAHAGAGTHRLDPVARGRRGAQRHGLHRLGGSRRIRRHPDRARAPFARPRRDLEQRPAHAPQ